MDLAATTRPSACLRLNSVTSKVHAMMQLSTGALRAIWVSFNADGPCTAFGRWLGRFSVDRGVLRVLPDLYCTMDVISAFLPLGILLQPFISRSLRMLRRSPKHVLE